MWVIIRFDKNNLDNAEITKLKSKLQVLTNDDLIEISENYEFNKPLIIFNILDDKIGDTNFNIKLIDFEIDEFRKNCLLEGLDDIGFSLKYETEISNYENKLKQLRPWILNE